MFPSAVTQSGLSWKSSDSGVAAQSFASDKVESLGWSIFGRMGYLRVVMTDGTEHRLDGFPGELLLCAVCFVLCYMLCCAMCYAMCCAICCAVLYAVLCYVLCCVLCYMLCYAMFCASSVLVLRQSPVTHVAIDFRPMEARTM